MPQKAAAKQTASDWKIKHPPYRQSVLIEIEKSSLRLEQDVNHHCYMPQLLTPNADSSKPTR